MAAAKKAAAAKAAPKAAVTAAASTADSAPEGAGADKGRDDGAQGESEEFETIKPAEGEAFVLVRKGLERFHRCGMRFTSEPTVLVIAELGEGVLERLKAEPNLLVVEG
jgi:hypothetical protein